MRIAYVGPFAFPSDNANSLRVRGMVQALIAAGHEVSVVPGMGERCAPSGLQTQLRIHQLNEYGTGFMSGTHKGFRGLFLGDVTRDWLRNCHDRPDVVVLYGAHLGYMARLLPLCRRLKIPLVLDLVEWYDGKQLPGGRLGPFTIANEVSMRYAVPQADGAIAISKYLSDYYSARGMNVTRVPPLFDADPLLRPAQFRDSNHKLNVCYAGSPGVKEDLATIAAALKLAASENVEFFIHVVGVSQGEFEALTSIKQSESHDWLRCYGRVPNSIAREIVARSDFSMVVRNPAPRFVRAGFPSKVAESLALGTPLMCNIFSDLHEVLVDGRDSILIERSTMGLVRGLKQASSMSEEALKQLKVQAALTGRRDFTPSKYAVSLNLLLAAARP